VNVPCAPDKVWLPAESLKPKAITSMLRETGLPESEREFSGGRTESIQYLCHPELGFFEHRADLLFRDNPAAPAHQVVRRPAREVVPDTEVRILQGEKTT
jgi:hypothetical protein